MVCYPVPTLMPSSAPSRLASLDIFRGATVASMMLVNYGGPGEYTYPPLLHAAWHGWTFTDTVFPFFLWIVGVSMTFSFARRIERGDDRRRLLLHAVRRGLIIIAIGLFLNAFPVFDLAHLRIPGVLQRIGLCYLLAAAIFLYTRVRGQVAAIAALLGSYWMLMTLYPVPGHGAGVLTPEGNFSAYIDSLLLSGHMYARTITWDPEGTVSTLPAIATVLFGALAGHLLRSSRSAMEKAGWLMAAGAIGFGLGHVLGYWMPVNKPIWTAPYSVLMAGLAALTLGVWFWLTDIQGWRRGTRWLEIYGSNAIAVYAGSGLIEKLLIRGGVERALFDSLNSIAPSPQLASLTVGLLHVAAYFLIAWVLHVRGIFLRV